MGLRPWVSGRRLTVVGGLQDDPYPSGGEGKGQRPGIGEIFTLL